MNWRSWLKEAQRPGYPKAKEHPRKVDIFEDKIYGILLEFSDADGRAHLVAGGLHIGLERRSLGALSRLKRCKPNNSKHSGQIHYDALRLRDSTFGPSTRE